jgi:hypothetical protein
MDTRTYYPTAPVAVNSSALRGRYLTRSLKGKEAAFAGADLYRGVKQLVEPTLAQAAFLTGSNVNAVWWALHRREFREEILCGEMPLVPPPSRAVPVPASNGNDVTPPMTVGVDQMLAEAIRIVGIDHALAIAARVERGMSATS